MTLQRPRHDCKSHADGPVVDVQLLAHQGVDVSIDYFYSRNADFEDIWIKILRIQVVLVTGDEQMHGLWSVGKWLLILLNLSFAILKRICIFPSRRSSGEKKSVRGKPDTPRTVILGRCIDIVHTLDRQYSPRSRKMQTDVL